jgi:glycosyltransferase involved in cell wall biosynthesis
MKILQVILHEGVGGMESVAVTLEHGLKNRGHDVLTSALDRGAQNAGQKSQPLIRLWQLSRVCRRFRPDAILAHSAIPTAYVRLLLTSAPQVAVVHSLGRDLLEPRLRRAEWLTGMRTSATIFVAAAALELYRREFPGRGGNLRQVINGVSCSLADALPLRNWPPENFLAVSRLTPSKDLITTIRGFSAYAATHQSAQLRIVGDAADPAYEKQLRELVNMNHVLAHRIEFLGRREDVGGLMARSDLLVHASHFESQGLVLAEAAVQGLPAICTRAVAKGVSWPSALITFSASDYLDLASAIVRTAADIHVPAQARAKATQARRVLDPEVMIDAYESLLTSSIRANHLEFR